MIDLREEALKRTKGVEYWMIRCGLTNIPQYVFRNIQEFKSNDNLVKPNQLFIIPKLTYHPFPESVEGEIRLSFQLRDQSGELEALANPQGYNVESGKWLIHSLEELHPGELLAYVVLRNRYQAPYSEGSDEKIYLTGFWSPRIRKPKSGLSDLVSKLSDLIPDLDPLPTPVPVRV